MIQLLWAMAFPGRRGPPAAWRRVFAGLQGGFKGGAFGFGDFGEFVGGGFVVDRLAPAFEQGAAVVDLEADAVFSEGVRVFGKMDWEEGGAVSMRPQEDGM